MPENKHVFSLLQGDGVNVNLCLEIMLIVLTVLGCMVAKLQFASEKRCRNEADSNLRGEL